MFQDVLRDVVERSGGGMAALLMGFDGLPVDQYVKDTRAVEVEAVAMEYTVILREVQKAAHLLEAGDTEEVCVRSENLMTVMRLLNKEYFLTLTLAPNGNLGKARYLMRQHASALRNELE